MDIKTQRRIKAFKQKQAEQRRKLEGPREPLTDAERQRRMKLSAAKKRKPGFGTSSASVADHLNEVVGLTEHKMSMREQRDKRIEQAAKEKKGVNRYRNPNSKSVGMGQTLGNANAPASRLYTKEPGLQNSSREKERAVNARQAFLDRLQQKPESD